MKKQSAASRKMTSVISAGSSDRSERARDSPRVQRRRPPDGREAPPPPPQAPLDAEAADRCSPA